jgi:hypothetical protein
MNEKPLLQRFIRKNTTNKRINTILVELGTDFAHLFRQLVGLVSTFFASQELAR